MFNHEEFFWVLVYISAFGISDYIVKNYIKNKIYKLVYYLCIGIIAFTFILNKENFKIY